MIAALFVDGKGCYSHSWDIDVWDIKRDARLYDGNFSVVAHPPCNLWVKFAFVNYARWGGDHNKPGNDGGCFKSALDSVHRCGGVIEHPAFSYAWDKYNLPKPSKKIGWQCQWNDVWVCEIWQSAYGHKARKRTWLYYCGKNKPSEMIWDRPNGLYQIGFHDQRGKAANKPTISGKEASATPIKFRDALVNLAENCGSNNAPNFSID